MALEVVQTTNTFEQWRQLTNRLAADIGNIESIATPIVTAYDLVTDYVIGAPTTRSSSWSGTSAEVTASIHANGSIYVLPDITDDTKRGTDYQVDDELVIPGNRLEGVSPENDLTVTVATVNGAGGILTFKDLAGTPQKSLKNIINKIRADVGDTSTLTTTAQTIIGAVNEHESDIDALDTSVTTLEAELGGSVADDYDGGSETTVIAALNSIAAVTDVSGLNNTYLRRAGVDAMTGTLNVAEHGITAGDNEFKITTGDPAADRLKINSAGQMGIGKDPDSSYAVDISGNTNSTKLFYGGTDIDNKYLNSTINSGDNSIRDISSGVVFKSTVTAEGDTDFTGTVSFDGTEFHSSGTSFTENIQDTIGAMVAGNTETGGITATYDDANGKLDLDIDQILTLSQTVEHGTWDRTANSNSAIATGQFQIRSDGSLWVASVSKESSLIAESNFSDDDVLYFETSTKKYIARITSVDSDTINSVLVIKLSLSVIAGDVPDDQSDPATLVHGDVPIADVKIHTVKYGTLDPEINIPDKSIDFDKLIISGTRGNGKILEYSNTTGFTYGEIPDSSMSTKGLIEIATSAESNAGTDTERAMTPALVKARIDAIPSSTIATQGLIEIATSAESITGTDTERAMTPALVKARIDAATPNGTSSVRGLLQLSTQTQADTGSDTATAMTPALVRRRISTATPTASSARRGLIQIATSTQSNSGTSTGTAMTPALVKARIDAIPDSSETAKGLIEIATSGEASTGSDTSRAMTPALVKARIDTAITGIPNASTSSKGLIEIATSTEAATGTDTNRAMTPALVKARTGDVRTDWLFHNTSGQPVSIDEDGHLITCRANVTDYDYIMVMGNYVVIDAHKPQQVGAPAVYIRVSQIPSVRGAPPETATPPTGIVSAFEYDHEYEFYVWGAASGDEDKLYFELGRANAGTRLYIYSIIGYRGAGSNDTLSPDSGL